MNNKKIILVVILIVIILAGIIFGLNISGKNKTNSNKIKVTASNFASYDFLRAIIGDNDNIELTFLLGAGKDAHSYDPTAQDLVTIQKSDLFVYVGGEMESWSDKVMSSLDTGTTKVICVADDVDTMDEKDVDGAEKYQPTEEELAAEAAGLTDHSHEMDEHIWTSPKNAKKMVEILEESMEEIDPENASKYKTNAENYISQIEKVDSEIQEIVDNRVRDRLIFGDKMPMQYFIDYYGLEVSAAFKGCSTETEPSAQTISYLVEKAKSEKSPVILYIELSDGKVAKTIAEEVGNGCEAMQIQTLHNLSKTDFDNGETWVSLMERNLDVLKKALQ